MKRETGLGLYHTVYRVESGRVYDRLERGPSHNHQGDVLCPDCKVVNGWTEKWTGREVLAAMEGK